MVKSQHPTSSDSSRLDRLLALVIAVLAAGLLSALAARDLLPGDAGEFQFAAWQWGLAHPTGYPFYLLAGGLWQHLWAGIGVSPAASLNLLSALFTGLAAGLLYWLLVGWLPGPALIRRLAALLSATMLIAVPTMRSQSLLSEVYALHAVFMIAILIAAQKVVSAQRGQRPSSGDGGSFAPEDANSTRATSGRLVVLSFLLGLALTHHATTVLLIPALAIYLWLTRRAWWHPARSWLWMIPAFALPLLLYLYVPLRGGPAASPWYHQPLGRGELTLYANNWPSFVDYVTGRSISVGFFDLQQAMANAPAAWLLWLQNFAWLGLLLVAVGLFVLVRTRNWPVLALTVTYVVVQQLFNLFYAIGDIFVYYIPVYLIGCIWIGFAAAGIGVGFGGEGMERDSRNWRNRWSVPWGLMAMAALFWLPLQQWVRYTPALAQVQTESTATRATWEQILAAQPPAGAILVSNDRNEIVPLFYLQTVERRAAGHTGLFPLIAPEDRFADIGATIQTALDQGGAQRVYLIKPMPGLEARFQLAPRTPPLVEVLGPAATAAPAMPVEQPYGPLHLLGYDWTSVAEGAQIDLHWRVDERPALDYTTTVQVFDAAGAKIGQEDRKPGGAYYPTSLWKPGETLVDSHRISLAPGAMPARLLVGMYAGPEATLLAPPLELPLHFLSP